MMVSFDSVNLTANTESHARVAKIDTLQLHHAATTSFNGARALMDPGGRQVSSNGLLGNDGHLQEVVEYKTRRAFTSGVPAQDQRSFTVETVNESAGPTWGISDASERRLARLLAELHLEFGVPIRRGQPGLLGHREVPGTYATACPGPDMNLDRIVSIAAQYVTAAAGNGGIVPIEPETENVEMEYLFFKIVNPGGVGLNGTYWMLDRGYLCSFPTLVVATAEAARWGKTTPFEELQEGSLLPHAEKFYGIPQGTWAALNAAPVTAKCWFRDGPGGGGFTSADRTALLDIPTNGEMGQALTSTVSLVNQHADVNKDAIIAAIESAPAAAAGGPLTVHLTGDLTGTASPPEG